MASDSETRLKILEQLAVEYQELNGSHVETLHNPSPIEFLRAVHVGRPVLIKGFRTPALYKWSDEYLIERMGETRIQVAVTPDGTFIRSNADAIVADDNGRKHFVEPHVEHLTMKGLLEIISQDKPQREVYYLQSQNGNVYTVQGEDESDEFAALRCDVPRDVPWASEALGTSPDAVNIWIGDERSVTSLHSDPYENIYTVVRGQKTFILFPPTEGWCLRERMYPHAQYSRVTPRSSLVLTPSPPSTPQVRWSSIRDPCDTEELSAVARPIHVTLSAADTLYLPAGWWHYVRQKDVTVALNWWYDMEPRGMGWVWLNFLRGESIDVPDGNADTSNEDL